MVDQPHALVMADRRTAEQLRRHYEVERELAQRLYAVSRDERHKLYSTVYDELYARVPDIPHRDLLDLQGVRAAEVSRLVGFLRRFVQPGSTFLEIGPGDCRVSAAIAAMASRVYAIDVTRNLVDPAALPSNVTFDLADGLELPLEDRSVDVAFTDQMLEHLHPDDAAEHLRNVRRVLKPGGRYVCITPNRLYGPHDVSCHFGSVAQGLHLREYSVTDAMEAFSEAGYRDIRPYTVLKGLDSLAIPTLLVRVVEGSLGRLPDGLRRGLACSVALRWILRARVVGTK